jgi:heme oxygenase
LVAEIIKRNKHILPTDQILPADRSEHLKQDLLNLNKSLLISDFKLKHYSDFSSLPGLIGLIYVVKGSELGGNIIGKQIEKHRKRWHVKPAIFYKTTPQDMLMKDWQTWCNHVNALVNESNTFINQTINSAKMAFNLFTHPEKFGEFTTKQVI